MTLTISERCSCGAAITVYGLSALEVIRTWRTDHVHEFFSDPIITGDQS